MKKRYAQSHMRAAFAYANNSFCHRKKVGCVIVKDGTPIAIGWNGTPSGENNECEENGVSKPNIIHAEDNALRKLVRSHESSIGATVFITAAPCIRCAEKLMDARVSKVYYAEVYHGATFECGLEKLVECGIETELLELE